MTTLDKSRGGRRPKDIRGWVVDPRLKRGGAKGNKEMRG